MKIRSDSGEWGWCEADMKKRLNETIITVTIWIVLFFTMLIPLATANAQAPAAAFSGMPTSGIVPLTVAFTDQSTGTPNGRVWYFGDETYLAPWRQVNASSGWAPRYAHSSVAMPDGSIMLMGGFDGVQDRKSVV